MWADDGSFFIFGLCGIFTFGFFENLWDELDTMADASIGTSLGLRRLWGPLPGLTLSLLSIMHCLLWQALLPLASLGTWVDGEAMGSKVDLLLPLVSSSSARSFSRPTGRSP